VTVLGELVRRLIAGIMLSGTVVVAELQVLHLMQLNVGMRLSYFVSLQ
jgi:hypothetical protein